MARLVEQKLKKPLAEAMVFGSLKEGGTALADVQDDELVATCKRSALMHKLPT